MNNPSAFDLMLSSVTPMVAGLCFIAGILGGIFYFWGLWWSIKRLPRIQNKKSFLFYSFFVRILLFLMLMVWVAGKNPARLILFFLGFILSRIFMLRRQRKIFCDREIKK